jgi:hypothetical protein
METANEQIKIRGTLFEIDREGHQLIEKNDRTNTISYDGDHKIFHFPWTTLGISFRELEWAREDVTEVALVPYDRKTHNIVNVDWGHITSIPKGLVMIEIPFEGKLDPYGYARENHLNISDYLRQNPIGANQSARVIPWEEIGIDSIISENIRAGRTIKNKAELKTKSTAGKKKGKRL